MVDKSVSTSGFLYKKINFYSWAVDKYFAKQNHSMKADQTKSLMGWSNKGTMNDCCQLCLDKVYASMFHKCARILKSFMSCKCDQFEQIVLRFALTVMRRCAMETVSSLTTSCMRWYERMHNDMRWYEDEVVMRGCIIIWWDKCETIWGDVMFWWCDTMLPERRNH